MALALRIGIPRGLLYHYYGEVWADFFRRLGAEPVVSPETTRATVAAGGAVDEVCLPVKAFFGHAQTLAGRVDRLFLPRVVSTAAGHYTCPKIIGLPDIMRAVFPGGPPLIAPPVSLRDGSCGLWRAVAATGAALGRPALASLWAWRQAWRSRRPPQAAEVAPGARPRVAVAGHPYILYDRQISMDAVGRLAAMGLAVVPVDRVAPQAAERAAATLSKDIFWHYCRRLAGAALYLLAASPPLAGMVFLTSFACGPDSLVGELLRRRAERRGVPFLLLALDEHTAEAGVVTRLEAFADMLRRRQPWS